jgi:hypothetical protein
LETKIQEILDNSNPTNFLRAMRLAELLANDFENVEQVGYGNVLKHLNYTLVNHQLDYLSRSQQSKFPTTQSNPFAERPSVSNTNRVVNLDGFNF